MKEGMVKYASIEKFAIVLKDAMMIDQAGKPFNFKAIPKSMCIIPQSANCRISSQ
jgi:hypothetical protein